MRKPKIKRPKINHKHLQTGYLYGDGHFVGIYEKTVRINGQHHDVKWAEAYESIGIKAQFEGRVIFDKHGATNLLKHPELVTVGAEFPDIKNGSDHTRRLGLVIGYVWFGFRDGSKLYFNTLPTVLSGPFTYQPTLDGKKFGGWEDIRDLHRWGDFKLTRHFNAPAPSVAA